MPLFSSIDVSRYEVVGPILGVGMLISMLVLTYLGHRYGKKLLAANPDAAVGTGAIEAAVFSLLGLLIAFTFSGAFSRLDARRKLVVDEVNAINTAFLRLDLIDDLEPRQQMQELLKQYVESRLRLWDKMTDRTAALDELALANGLQNEIWTSAITLTASPDLAPVRRVLLPALNQMFDLSKARVVAVRTHPPPLIYGALFTLASIGAFLVGFSMAKSQRLNWFHVKAFACVMSFMVCLILDIDFPRVGFVRLDAVHKLFGELHEVMVQRMGGGA